MAVSIACSAAPTQYLARPEGRVAWSVVGDSGPLVVAMPGMGDVRTSWDAFAQTLAQRGYRVAVLDLRGLGESDVTFSEITREAVGSDALALADSLSPNAPVHFIGNSWTAASALWCATEAPTRTASVLMSGPFARIIPLNWMQKAAFGVLFRRPWGAWVWSRYYGSIFANRRPADWTARRDAVHKNLSEPGRFAALQRMLPAMSRDCETRLDSVNKPVLVVMGTKDPDFADPIAEAKLLAQRSHGTVHLIEGGGHYPHAEDPAKFAQIAADFFAKVATP